MFAALRVITARNPVHSALFLVLSFFTAAALWLLLRAEFLAIALVLVYVGAVMVLFLFVVMMLDVNLERAARAASGATFPVAARSASLMLVEMALVLRRRLLRPAALPAPPDRRRELQQHQGSSALQIVYRTTPIRSRSPRCMLLVAIIAAIALTLGSASDTKYSGPGAVRCAVQRSERVRLVVDAVGEERLRTLMAGVLAFAVAFPDSRRGAVRDQRDRHLPQPASNVIIMLMAIELMLLAVNMNFIAFSHYLGDIAGQVFVFFILTVAAAESAIGLAILVVLFRNIWIDQRRGPATTSRAEARP